MTWQWKNGEFMYFGLAAINSMPAVVRSRATLETDFAKLFLPLICHDYSYLPAGRWAEIVIIGKLFHVARESSSMAGTKSPH